MKEHYENIAEELKEHAKMYKIFHIYDMDEINHIKEAHELSRFYDKKAKEIGK